MVYLLNLFFGAFILASHLVFCSDLLDWILVAIILVHALIIIFRISISRHCLFIAINLITILVIFDVFFFTFFLALFDAFLIWINQLVLLNHALKVFENHLACQESSN